jgi:hypothetical protein
MKPPDSTLDRLMAMNAELFPRGECEAAFHTLMAALHVAEHARDVTALDRIGAVAKAQSDKIDAMQPPHKLSKAQADQRGQVPVYRTLQLHVDTVRLRLQSREALEDRRP